MTRAGEKVLTMSLAGACAGLFALAVAMQLGVGRGYHWNQDGAGSAEPVAGATIDQQSFELPPQSEFAVIGERPVFNEDRKPAPEPSGDNAEAPPPSPLNISLTGTVLVGKPPVRIAMVRENGKATTISLKEGMPLPGDQAAWTLSQVKNRSAIFKSSTGEEVEVELAVASAGQKPNPAPARPGAMPPGHAGGAPGGTVAAQSEELQRRIEERRKQMREAAERMKAQRPPEQNQPQQQQQ